MVSSYPNNRSALSKHWSRLIHYNLTCYPRRNHGYLLAIQFILFSIRLSSSFSGYPRHNQSYPVACHFLGPPFHSSQKSHVPNGTQVLDTPCACSVTVLHGKETRSSGCWENPRSRQLSPQNRQRAYNALTTLHLMRRSVTYLLQT